MESSVGNRTKLLICAGLAAGCAAIYGQTLSHGFTTYDDGLYVFDNARVRTGLRWDNMLWAFTTQLAMYAHPLTWLSHMLDCSLYGLRPWGHHLTNLLFHTANAVLLFLVFVRMTRRAWPSALVAALFAVHPLHVESVAWVAERKDLLSMLFWTTALGAHARYRERPGPARYLAVAFVFFLGLLSKPMVVTLPCVLLLLDYWPLEQVNRAEPLRAMARKVGRLAVEKIPLFLLTALFCAITMIMQARGNNLAFGDKVPLAARGANAVVVYVLYLVKTVWPADLAVYYPHPITRPGWQVAGAALILITVTLFCLRHARRHPYLIVGWLWYLGTLVPVIELVQAGTFSHADRYTYIPLIGVFVMVAWGLDHLRGRGPMQARTITAAAALAVAALTLCAHKQTGYWKDDTTLFSRDLAVVGNNPVAQNIIGAACMDRGKADEAIKHYKLALAADPRDGQALYNLGVVMSALHQPVEAEAYYREALRCKPDLPKARNNLAGILAETGRMGEAVEQYRKALELAPGFADAHNNLANLLVLQGNLDGAVEEYGKALEINPDHISVRLNLANIFMYRGRRDEARTQLNRVLNIEPGNKNALKLMAQLEAARVAPSPPGPGAAK